jgi:hypothetical protein
MGAGITAWGGFRYHDAYGNISSTNAVVSTGPPGGSYPPHSVTYTDNLGNTLKVATGPSASILVNGSWVSLPIQTVGSN